MVSVMSSSDMTVCFLLGRIPPEIRNHIYEMVYTYESSETVDLLDAGPPKKSLLLTCRRIYDEVRLLHRDMYRKYWTGNEFCIRIDQDLDRNRAVVALIQNQSAGGGALGTYVLSFDLKDEDLLHISSLLIEKTHADGDWSCYYFKDGVWSGIDDEDDDWSTAHSYILVADDPKDVLGGRFYCRAPSHGFNHWVVIVKGTMPEEHRHIHSSDVEIEEAKRLVGKTGLTRRETLDMIAVAADGMLEQALKEAGL